MFCIRLFFFYFFFLLLSIIVLTKIKKKSYRSFQILDDKIENYISNLPLLKSDTNNVIEYVENNVNQNKKTYHFWKLLTNNEK